jgi:hypothetical protein
VLFAAAVGMAADPVTVTVEGRATAPTDDSGGARDEAIQAALQEAALEVAQSLLPVPLLEEQEDALWEALGPVVSGVILTYRIEQGGELRPIEDAPDELEYVVVVTATVDAAQLRNDLRRLGYVHGAGDRPSVVVAVRSDSFGGPRRSDVRLEPLERTLREELLSNGFVVLEPGVLPGPDPESQSAAELARSVGADVAVEVGVRLRRTGLRTRIVGIVAEVSARAVRVRDGYELALVQLDTPAYHLDPDEATMRAVDAVREPLAQNLRVQLEQNWVALASDQRPIRLVLHGVTRFSQVSAVYGLLQGGTGIDGLELRTLGPGQAEFALAAAPSPGVLQARLVRAKLPGFRLDPLSVTVDQIEVAVREVAPETPAVGPAPR